MPDLSHERQYYPRLVCGIDEVGRGPWAGPVVAACVILPPEKTELINALDDSKKLTRSKREQLYPVIIESCEVGIGESTPEEIDEINIWKATERAMQRAFDALTQAPCIALVDGNRHPALACETVTIIKGDSISASIAAASIIAKVTRDRYMEEMDLTYPHYAFARHMGYGTKAHQLALAEHGPCPLHRRSFAPIRALLAQEA